MARKRDGSSATAEQVAEDSGAAIVPVELAPEDISESVTGEIVDSSATLTLPADMMSLLDEATNASESDFVNVLDDFWKPDSPGKSFRGLYLRKQMISEAYKLYQYVFAVRNETTGLAEERNVNSTYGLRKKMKDVKVGTPLLITYVGEKVTGSGRKFRDWDVKELKRRVA